MLDWIFNPLGLLGIANILVILTSIIIGLRAYKK